MSSKSVWIVYKVGVGQGTCTIHIRTSMFLMDILGLHSHTNKHDLSEFV